MKKISAFLLLLPLVLCFTASAQILEPIKWICKSQQVGPGEYKLTFTAKVKKGWHIFTQYMNAEGGPIPTKLIFDAKNDIQLIGKANERGSRPNTKFNSIWEMVITSYEDDLILEQRVKVLKDTKLTGVVTAMSCNEEGGLCVGPIDNEFAFELKRSPGVKIEWEHPEGN